MSKVYVKPQVTLSMDSSLEGVFACHVNPSKGSGAQPQYKYVYRCGHWYKVRA